VRRAVLLAVLAWSFWGCALLAEVSVTPSGQPLVLAKEGKVWSPVRRGIVQRYLLNPHGDDTGDLAPDVALSPVTGFPEVVWSAGRGDYEIVFARWTGALWEQTVLAGQGADDLLPRLMYDPWGNRFLAWVRKGPAGGMHLAASPPGELAFSRARRLPVAGELGRDPDLAFLPDGSVLAVWFEEATGGGPIWLSLAMLLPSRDSDWILRGGEDLPNPLLIGRLELSGTSGTLPLAGADLFRKGGGGNPAPAVWSMILPAVRWQDDRIWVTWVQTTGERHLIGYSRVDGGGLGPVRFLPLKDLRQKSIEAAQEDVRRIVVGQTS